MGVRRPCEALYEAEPSSWMLLADDSSALLDPNWQSSPNISVGLSESGVYTINFDITLPARCHDGILGCGGPQQDIRSCLVACILP